MMRVSLGRYSIEMKGWETKEEIGKVLERCDAGRIVLGEEAEIETEFYTVIVQREFSNLQTFGIGICSEGQGIVPHLLPAAKLEALWLGYNREVTAISLEKKEVLFKIHLDSLFSAFYYIWENDLILVFHEIGVVAMRETGEVLWKYEADLITDAWMENEQLHLKFMEADPVSLPLFETQKKPVYY